ncbi:MAG: carboxymuconolactone decarboxylase family protein [Myxococcota bacterium]
MTLPLHTLESAPEASQPILEGSKKSLGFVPNLYAVMAESPELLKAYGALSELFQASSFSVEEQTVVWQTFNVEHACHYCVPAHTAIAHMQKVDPAVTEALRNRSPLPNARLETLRDTALELVRNRGHVSAAQQTAFADAGFTPRQLLELVLGLSQKTISNYVNHLADTPVDPAFAKFTWETKDAAEPVQAQL